MGTKNAGRPRSAEEVRQARRAVIGAAIGLAVVLVAIGVYGVASGRPWLIGVMIAIGGGSGASLWIAYRSADEDG